MRDENCIFCRIVEGKISSVKIWEDEKCIVILDKFPATKGQTLVITKEHVPYIMNLNEATYNHIFNIARKISIGIDKSLKTIRTCIVVEGFEGPHVHIRLHPAYENILSTKGREATIEDLKDVADKIRKNL